MSAISPKDHSISIYLDQSLRVDVVARYVIQAPKPEPRILRYELFDCEWAAIKPMLPDKPRGMPRVNAKSRLRLNAVNIELGAAKFKSSPPNSLFSVHLSPRNSAIGPGLSFLFHDAYEFSFRRKNLTQAKLLCDPNVTSTFTHESNAPISARVAHSSFKSIMGQSSYLVTRRVSWQASTR